MENTEVTEVGKERLIKDVTSEGESDFESSASFSDDDSLIFPPDFDEIETDSESDEEEKPKVEIEPRDPQGVIKSGVWKLLTNEEISLYNLMDPSFITRIYDTRNRKTREIIFSELFIDVKSKKFIMIEIAKLQSVGIKIDLEDPSSALELSPRYPEYRKSLNLIAKYLHNNFVKTLVKAYNF